MVKSVNQGSKANYNGKKSEAICLKMLINKGFVIVKRNEDKPERWVMENVPFTSIYGHNAKTEFVIGFDKREIRIEIKTQNAAGSVDEKLPYVLLNAIEAYPENETIIILEGNGFKNGAKEWVHKMIENNWLGYKQKGKTIQVMDLNNFGKWLDENIE